jgi:outer membrane protein OmpA-like peptidoglycan-associated protein
MRNLFPLFILCFAGMAPAQDMEFQVELLGPAGTNTSRAGDRVLARVVVPGAFAGDTVEGRVADVRQGARNGGRAVLNLRFDVLQHGGQAIPITSEVVRFSNSQGRADVDDSGRPINRGGAGDSAKVMRSANSVGGLVGGITGSKNVAIGRQSGNTAASVAHDWSSDAPEIRFGAGSRLTLKVRTQAGRSLANLAPVQGAPAPAGVTAVAQQPVAAAPVAIPSAYVPAQSQQPAGAAQAQQPAPQGQQPAAAAQPEMTTLKSTFIPGEKTLFFDDFTDMTADDAPPHFKVRGAAPMLKGSGNIRQLTVTQRGSLFPNLTSLPKNFTFEAEIKGDTTGGRAISTLILNSKGKQILQLSTTVSPKIVDLVASLRAPYSELGRKRAPTNWDEPVKLALWVQNGRLRVFTNGEKQLDFNQVEMPPIDSVEFAHDFYGTNLAIGYRNVRFAESTPDFSQVISSSGRYVSHGILFDTDSDRLKPESAPVIQTIAKGLETNPNLRLLIEGHTDSVGNAAHNKDLSKRRAEAVKAVLVSQFNVDASRLTTEGMGSSKPLDSNDTPQGRSQNRRVEFVKQ